MKSSRVCSLVLTGLLVFLGVAHASVLTPGTGGQLPDIFSGCAGCTLLASHDTGVVTASSGGVTLSFDLVSAVYSDPNNTFGAGDLDFMYQVTNLASSNDSIGRVTVTNFTGFQTDVGYNLTGSTFPGSPFATDGTVAPGLVDRNTASTIGFGFAVPPLYALVGPGQASTVLVVETNATNFQLGQANVIDGQAVPTDAFGPAGTPSVPEPSTMILMGSGIAGLVRFMRKKLA